ncbi:MAG: amidohydrolase family protein [Armatimonadetes bacterium]|nr:amidohydrolase family protein [Armatimonadota bacterium]MBS1725216.1 amidohydrolase [Armatimonadota bacterium]
MRTRYMNFEWWRTKLPSQMVVEDGRVVIAPTIDEVMHPDDEVVDCGGKILLPGFIDAHCHILPTGLDLMKLDLVAHSTRESILDAVRDRHREQPDGWLLAVQYDNNKFLDGAHLTRDDLDAISPSRPILLRHYNGHCSIANSEALRLAGVAEDVPNPSGGEFVRDDSGRLNGVLLEDAHEVVWAATPKPNLDEMVEAILEAGNKMADLGITCASDMMTGRFDLLNELKAYQIAASRGCRVRTRLYVQWRDVFGPKGIGLERFRELAAGFSSPDQTRVAGIKLFADGAIGSATAAIYGSYSGQPAKGPVISRNAVDTKVSGTSGQLIYSPEKLTAMTRTASDAGYQVAIHAIGDYASDLVMDAFEATGDPSRHRIEHAMILSDEQIERLARLDCFVTFQPEFLLRFGHVYRRQLGDAVASKLERTRSVLDAGLKLSLNSDRPIVPGDPMDGIRTASSRLDGFDPAENCTLEEAILGYTVAGAEVNGDHGLMGSLEAGEVADFQLRDDM